MTRSIVLLSAGLDSTINLYEAHNSSKIVLVLTFDYGQKAAVRELEYANRQCQHLNLPHRIVSFPFFAEFTKTALVRESAQIPVQGEVAMDELEISRQTASRVWVPNRNGIFLNVAAGYAEGLDAEWIVPGFNREEAATFPDNSTDYIQALNSSLEFSTQGKVKAKCFTDHLDKSEIYRRGRSLGVNFQWIWPCYFGGLKPCGQCESCQRYLRAQHQAGS